MRSRRRHTGFVLMESLIALTILSLGVYVFAETCRRQHEAFERAKETERRATLLESVGSQ